MPFCARRDNDCDPLELNSQSTAGVAGLVHAARRSHVVAANALGSGLVETPALMAFLPDLCRRLLGEELQLPSSAHLVVWARGVSQVRAREFGATGHRTGDSESSEQANSCRLAGTGGAPPGSPRISRHRLANTLPKNSSFASTAPVWCDGTLRPGHIALRAFLVAEGDSYQVMPGAVAPDVSTSPPRLGDSMFVGHGSKDVWVLADGPVAPVTLLQPPGTPVQPRRSGIDLPSRVADNMFWLGRHIERAESATRLLRGVFSRG